MNKLTELKILVAIPSHLRAKNVSSLNLFPYGILFVADSQVEEYKQWNPDATIISHPDTVIGLTPKLNWIIQYAKDQKYDVLVKVDDDFKVCMSLQDGREVLDEEEMYQLLESWSQMAIDSGSNLFTTMETADVRKYESAKPFSLFSGIRIGFYGIILKHDQWFDERMVLKQDIDFALQSAYNFRHMWVDRRYSFIYKDTMGTSGGCADYRNSETEMKSIDTLKKKWGSYLFSESKNARVGKMTIGVRNPLV